MATDVKGNVSFQGLKLQTAGFGFSIPPAWAVLSEPIPEYSHLNPKSHQITSFHTYTAFFTGNGYEFRDNDQIPTHYACYDISAGDRRAVSYSVYGNSDLFTCPRVNSINSNLYIV